MLPFEEYENNLQMQALCRQWELRFFSPSSQRAGSARTAKVRPREQVARAKAVALLIECSNDRSVEVAPGERRGVRQR